MHNYCVRIQFKYTHPQVLRNQPGGRLLSRDASDIFNFIIIFAYISRRDCYHRREWMGSPQRVLCHIEDIGTYVVYPTTWFAVPALLVSQAFREISVQRVWSLLTSLTIIFEYSRKWDGRYPMI